jgi:hypothetical protein
MENIPCVHLCHFKGWNVNTIFLFTMSVFIEGKKESYVVEGFSLQWLLCFMRERLL